VLGLAVGTRAYAREELAEAAHEVLGARGFGPPPAAYDASGEYLHATVLDYGAHGCWFVAYFEGPASIELATGFARHLGVEVTAHEVELRDRGTDVRSVRVAPDGGMADVAPERDVPEAEEGDVFERLSHVLGVMVHQDVHEPVGELAVDLYRPASRGLGRHAEHEAEGTEHTLSPRLAELARQIRAAGRWELRDGRARVELADGVRISALSDEERALLEAATGLKPSPS